MRRVALLLCLLCCVLFVNLIGCAAQEGPSLTEQRISSYGRLAIVAVPGADADPAYAEMIISEVKKKAPSRLGFLPSVEFPTDLSVDAGTTPPTLILGPECSAYDAVAALVYSYSYPKGIVDLDIYMIDTTSGQSIWHHQLSRKDADFARRLVRHGWYTPFFIRDRFYHW